MAIRIKDTNVVIKGRLKSNDNVRVSKLTFAEGGQGTDVATLQFTSPSTQVGDLGIFFNEVRGRRLTGGYPASWTGINTISAQELEFLVSYKILTATDIDRNITGANGINGSQVNAISLRPSRTIKSVTPLTLYSRVNHICSSRDGGSLLTLPSSGYPTTIAIISYADSIVRNGGAFSSVNMGSEPSDTSSSYMYNKYKIYNAGEISENIQFDFCRVASATTILSYFYIQVD